MFIHRLACSFGERSLTFSQSRLNCSPAWRGLSSIFSSAAGTDWPTSAKPWKQRRRDFVLLQALDDAVIARPANSHRSAHALTQYPCCLQEWVQLVNKDLAINMIPAPNGLKIALRRRSRPHVRRGGPCGSPHAQIRPPEWWLILARLCAQLFLAFAQRAPSKTSAISKTSATS